MTPEQPQVGAVMRALQERAKELNCLYRVGEVLHQQDLAPHEMLERLVRILPQGWQYPASCQARITLGDVVAETPAYRPTPWTQAAEVRVDGDFVGRVEVSYREPMPRADEGPFMAEERRMIDSIAQRLAEFQASRALRAALAEQAQTEARPEWSIALGLLRGTSPSLLTRLTRRMINHLSWSGIEAARELILECDASDVLDPSENRPQRRGPGQADYSEHAFRLAAAHLGDGEILDLLTRWIKEDKSSALVNALERQDTPLGEIIDALERQRHAEIEEEELAVSLRQGLRVALLRRFFSEDLHFIDKAKQVVRINDFHDLAHRIVVPPRCHGKLGGKAAGLFLAQRIVETAPDRRDLLDAVRVPKTWYLPSDGVIDFVHYNNLEDVLHRKYMDVDQIRQEYPHLVQLFKRSSLPPAMARGIAQALDEFGDSPLIVRSSSLLEDRSGSVFSGKYKSLFLGNQGPRERRLEELMDAIAEVFASVFGPNPTEYRAERGLLDVHEEMGIVIQEVVGTRAGRFFFPACSGVAFSNNEFRWSPRISRADGLIRLVPGLGTRAVDRVSEDYPVLIAPGQPQLRVNQGADEVLKYSPKLIDVINLETNSFETIELQALLREVGNDYPRLADLVSIVEGDRVVRPLGNRLDPATQQLVFTAEGLCRGPEFVPRIRHILGLLRDRIGRPADIEFAWDGSLFYLLQCRPQSFSAGEAPAAIPQDIPRDRIVFSANRFVSNGRVPDITHVVYVDGDGYQALPDPAAMREVGRAIGRLNKLLPKRQFVLIGPGRWGSRGDIRLGVPVTYSDINNAAMLVEVAKQKGNYTPDLSFGTHFFQDLVEAGIRYLPLYPDDDGQAFNELFLRRADSVLGDLLPEYAHLGDTLRVIDVPRAADRRILRVLLNADIDQAVALLTTERQANDGEPSSLESTAERSADAHWSWRLRMAQRIADRLDAARFGVVALYVFGSTKNATARMGSDIDLLVHFRGNDDQREQLLTWLRGWSEALAEINFLRTGYRTDHLLDVHFITDDDIARHDSYAAKIDAITDAARPLPIGGALHRP